MLVGVNNLKLLNLTKIGTPPVFYRDEEQVTHAHIEGTIMSSKSIRKGTLYQVHDGTAEVSVFFHHNIDLKEELNVSCDKLINAGGGDLFNMDVEERNIINSLLQKVKREVGTSVDQTTEPKIFADGTNIVADCKLTMMFDTFTLYASCMTVSNP